MVAIPDTPFTRPELDVSRGTFFRMVADGRIREVVRGVYVRGSTVDCIEIRIAAARLALRPGQVLVDRSAAWVHGTDAFAWSEKEVVPRTEVCAVSGSEPVRRAGVAGGRRDLSRADVEVIEGLVITTPLRTAADLGCRLRRREAYAAMCDLARRHHLRASDLQRYVNDFKGRRGVIQFRELAPLVADEFESPREAWTWLAIHDAGLPPPTPQVWVRDQFGADFRIDLAYPRLRIAIEYDGDDFHSSEEARVRDRMRRRRLSDMGWRFVVVRKGDFTTPGLDRWIGELRGLLAEAYSPMRW